MDNGNYINGTWVQGTGEEFYSFNPANHELIWKSNASDEGDVAVAIQTARAAFVDWSALPFGKRAKLLKAYQAVLESKSGELAQLISQENGKPLWEAKTEVGAMVKKIDISITAYEDRCQTVEGNMAGAKSVTRFKPHGVALVFGPFNLPGHLPNGHIVPALLAGDTVVFKPSEQTPRVGEFMVSCFEEAKFPAGVVNLVQGGKETGEHLVEHGGFDALFFTGSCNVGKQIHHALGGHPEKMLALEMGGNNPLIVHNVKDLKAAAYLTIQSAYITAGQRCVCARRLVVPDGKAGDEFVKILQEMIGKIKVGVATDKPEPFMGPVISREAVERLLDAQSRLIEQGGELLIEMKQLKEALLTPGLIDVSKSKVREDVELFGPLLQLIRTSNFDEAIKEANHTAFGLSAGLLSDNKKDYDEFYQKARAGVINWNRQITGASSAAPFGGVGSSGNHQPSAYYAADYCSYPVASIECKTVLMPKSLTPGIEL